MLCIWFNWWFTQVNASFTFVWLEEGLGSLHIRRKPVGPRPEKRFLASWQLVLQSGANSIKIFFLLSTPLQPSLKWERIGDSNPSAVKRCQICYIKGKLRLPSSSVKHCFHKLLSNTIYWLWMNCTITSRWPLHLYYNSLVKDSYIQSGQYSFTDIILSDKWGHPGLHLWQTGMGLWIWMAQWNLCSKFCVWLTAAGRLNLSRVTTFKENKLVL